MPRRRRSDVVHTGQDAKLNAWPFMPLRTAKSLTTQRTREGWMRRVRTGGAHDCSVDCPSPSMPLVYVSRLQKMDGVAFGAAKCSCVRLRWDRGAGCGCSAACLVALALLFAVTVLALQRLYYCFLSLCDCGPGRNFQCDRIGGYVPAPVMSSISTSCCAWPAFFDQFA